MLKVELKTEGRLNFVPSVDGTHSFCFRQHQRGNQAILSLSIRSGERDAISTQIAQRGTIYHSVYFLGQAVNKFVPGNIAQISVL